MSEFPAGSPVGSCASVLTVHSVSVPTCPRVGSSALAAGGAVSSSQPSAPSDPGADPSQGAGTAVLEREELQSTDDGDADRYAHYVRKDKVTAAAVTGRPVVALCGKVWTPGRDPSSYPVCPTCKAIYEQMRDGDSSRGSGKGPRRPRFPFGRGGQ